MSNKTFVTILTIALITRIAGIWIPPLWYDENFTLILSRLPIDRMIQATMGDVHPPLWYLIEWSWSHFFTSPWALRVPALIFSTLALFPFHWLMDELQIPEKIQTAALLLMAILPMQIWYAQEARMYSLLELEVLAALYFAMRGKWFPLFIASLAMLYTQNYAVFYLACVFIANLLRNISNWKFAHRIGKFDAELIDAIFRPSIVACTSMLSAALAFMPWVKVIANQMNTISGRYWIQQAAAGDVLNIIYKQFFASSMPSFALLSGMLIVFMALGVGLVYFAHERHTSAKTIIIMAFGPLVLGWIASLLWQPILLHRPLIGIAPFLYLIVAWPFGRLFEREVKTSRDAILAAALVIPVLVSGIGGYYKNVPDMKSDGAVSPLIDALAYVKAHWQPGDIIYYTDDGPMVNLSPYAGGLPQYEIPVCGNHTTVGPVLGSLSPQTREAIGIPVRDLNEIDYRRAWVFAPRSPLHPECYEKQIALIAPVGEQLITVDDNEFISSGVWMVTR